ncbi:MAG TPA: cellulose biosynthesis protein BcsG [Burkholderiaceae bacterium]
MQAQATPNTAAIRLGGWSFYFLAKMLLVWQELIGFHPLENLAFAAFLLAPIGAPKWRLARSAVAIPVAIALLYYDSWLPPVGRVLSQAAMLSNFSTEYLMDLSARFINWRIVALLVLAWAVMRIAQKHLRVGAFVLAGLVGMAVMPKPGSAPAPASTAVAATGPATAGGAAPVSKDPDTLLKAFYAAEAQRNVALPQVDANGAAFDLVFLHICSLSWDDLEATGLAGHPLWQRMDFLFKRFNSAASYSGPAAIRINRALCGQGDHASLYKGVSEQCYLLPGLRKAGFASELALNHDGHFDDFLQQIRAQGVDVPMQSLAGIGIPQRGFDESPIYDDLGVLGQWLEKRKTGRDPRVALYYNSISLHDGNHIVAGPGAKLGIRENYKPRLEKLLDDLDTFLTQLEKSGRRAVVVVIPEHGAAIRGDKFQIAGLREMATPQVTTVPVGVAVIGPDLRRQGAPVQVDQPASYLAMSQLIGKLIAQTPYGEAGYVPAKYADGLPVTRFVSDNEAGALLEVDGRLMLRQGKEAWRPYPVQ